MRKGKACTLPEIRRLHQLRLVVYPHYLQGLINIPGGLFGISEPSTVAPENGWLEYGPASFWGKRPIFRGELAVSFREGSHTSVNQHKHPKHWGCKMSFLLGRHFWEGAICAILVFVRVK